MLDMIVANNLKVDGAGFGTAIPTWSRMITREKETELPQMSKEDAARNGSWTRILEMERIGRRTGFYNDGTGHGPD